MAIPFRLGLVTAVILTAFSGLLAGRRRTPAQPDPGDIPLLPVDIVRRLLVVAPHPDDETLAAGGIIQRVQAQGGEARVVFMTNGDGQAVAPLLLQRQVRPRAAGYITLGEQRQAEALAALGILDVPAAAAHFLGYPDRGLSSLWKKHWAADNPLRATYTRTTRSPYLLTFNPQAAYCGQDVLRDLRAITADYRPDLILIPHPHDTHGDHRATCHFTRLAVALTCAAHPAYRPSVWGYLVHYGSYPLSNRRPPVGPLLPPASLSGLGREWTRLNLTPVQQGIKARALQRHATQQRLLGYFLRRFVRDTELFARVPGPNQLAATSGARIPLPLVQPQISPPRPLT